MPNHGEPADFATSMTELDDAFARIRAQIHVLRLAMGGLRDERDVRALLSQLAAIEDDLQESKGMLTRHGSAH